MTARSASMLRGGWRSSSSPTPLSLVSVRGCFSTVATGSIRLLGRDEETEADGETRSQSSA